MESIVKTKKFRDPIYGYIEIEESVVRDIIDTAAFQRLRNIRQTSYGPLYPSALHNRFVHSLGVYHLGCLAFRALSRSLQANEGKETLLGDLCKLCQNKLDGYREVFQLASLLHDVGHSPFSHTGEAFYETSVSAALMTEEQREEYRRRMDEAPSEEEKRKCKLEFQEKYSIYKHLAHLTGDSTFADREKMSNAAPHELMSCIVALEAFGQNARYFKSDEDRSFFARCITGAQYLDDFKDSDTEEMEQAQLDEIQVQMFQNCVIQLLHSSVIDVDRLDYIIRDASVMGYQSVSIDYERLLNGLELVVTDSFQFTVGFHKNAISVIENAVYAHDNEKKWVQTHPAILYDGFLVHKSIQFIQERMNADYPHTLTTLFSYDSLTDEGSLFKADEKPEMRIRYLCDADLIYLMKNQYRNEYSEEYFSRNTRRRPIWKSEAEFRYLFDEGEQAKVRDALKKIIGEDNSMELTEDILADIEEEIQELQKFPRAVEKHRKKKEYVEKLFKVCDKYAVKEGGIVMLSSSFFNSNFAKKTMGELPVLFSGSEKKKSLKDVTPTLFRNPADKGKFYYLFYDPGPERKRIDVHQFAQDLLEAFRD